MKPPFILVDGSSYLYRAFHALPPLMNSNGEPTGAVYGVINMLRKLLKDYQPEYIAVVFDAKGKTFRDDLFEAYKMHRAPMPDDLQLQIAPVHAVVKALGLPLLMIEGVEADDVIGTLAQQASALGWHTLISTGDKDMAQLVNDKITLINTMSGTILDRQGVINKFGVPPESIIDYLTLVGDSSDNIPGVPGVGPKTAAKWLQEYGSLEKLTANAEKISGKVGENFRAHISEFALSRQLVTIKQDVDLPLKPAELKHAPAQREQLISWFKRLEFKSWLNEVLEEEKKSITTQPVQHKTAYEIILTEKDFANWVKQLQQAEIFSVSIKTNCPEYMLCKLTGIAFAIPGGKAAYIPLQHDYAGAPAQLSLEQVLPALKDLLEDPARKIATHDLKFMMNVMRDYAINMRAKIFDVMLESYVLDSTGTRHDIDALVLKYLGHRNVHLEDIAGKGVKQLTFNQIGLDQALSFAAEEADIILQLHQMLWPRLEQLKGLQHTFANIEMPLVPVLSRVECYGVLIDDKLLQKQSQEFAKRIFELEQKAYQLGGQQFNLSSPKQLQAILFEKLQLPILEKTPTGQASTGESVLQELAFDYELPKVILEFRSLSKLKSTYLDQLPQQKNNLSGRVHTWYHQAVAATGRLSSSDPNLQNIPIRTEEGRRIRQAFIAPKNHKIIAADYSQIELRIMAHLSQDPGLLKAFAQGIDIHMATASEVFSVPLDKVTSEQRRRSKAINFGLIYGMSAFGLARTLGIDRDAAQSYMDLYFARYPGVKQYMEATRLQAHQQGFVETLFGRRLNLPEINVRNVQRQRAAERAAINAPLQGSAADIIKMAMICVDAELKKTQLNAVMIMQVHDELVFEVAADQVDAAVAMIKDCMINPVKLDVPLVVEVGVGDNWDMAH